MHPSPPRLSDRLLLAPLFYAKNYTSFSVQPLLEVTISPRRQRIRKLVQYHTLEFQALYGYRTYSQPSQS